MMVLSIRKKLLKVDFHTEYNNEMLKCKTEKS